MKKIFFILPILLVLFYASNISAGGAYAVKRTNIGASSVNLDFDFVATIVQIHAPTANTDEVCIDWNGGTAICAGANIAGDDRLVAGTAITLDNFNTRSISVISASGTQTVYIRAWR